MRHLCGTCRFGYLAGTTMVYLFMLAVGIEVVRSGVMTFYFPWVIRILADRFVSRISDMVGYIVFAGLFCGLIWVLSDYSVSGLGSGLHEFAGLCRDRGTACDSRHLKRSKVFVKPLLALIIVLCVMVLVGSISFFELSPSRRQGDLLGAAITAQVDGFTAASLSSLDREVAGQFMVDKSSDYYFASGWALDLRDWPFAAELSSRLVQSAAAKANYGSVAIGIVQIEAATQQLPPCSLVSRSLAVAPNAMARKRLMYLFLLSQRKGVISGAKVSLYSSLRHLDDGGFIQAVGFLNDRTPSRLPGSAFSLCHVNLLVSN